MDDDDSRAAMSEGTADGTSLSLSSIRNLASLHVDDDADRIPEAPTVQSLVALLRSTDDVEREGIDTVEFFPPHAYKLRSTLQLEEKEQEATPSTSAAACAGRGGSSQATHPRTSRGLRCCAETRSSHEACLVGKGG